MRLDKFLSQLKYGSRKEVKEFIKNRRIKVENREEIKPEMDFDPEQSTVYLDGEAIFYKKHITLLVNKPTGVLSSTNEAGKVTVIDLLKPPYQRFDFGIAGRLDEDAEGLLILTTDGALIHRIISPTKAVMKKYAVTLEAPLGNYSELEKGVDLFNGKSEVFRTKPAVIEPISPHQCYISIGEGKFHQVKRMFAAIGNRVLDLKRIQIGNLKLPEDLPLGGYRELDPEEIEAIFMKASAQSSKI